MIPEQNLQNFPTQPGVYQMLDNQGLVIYVGKARNLQKRISSYFRRATDRKTQVMLAEAVAIQTTITRNENEALLLEANLIKQIKPRYNVLLRDDKSYPYLYLNTSQTFPRLDFYRGNRRAPGRYFGPFPNAGSVRDNLALIQKIFRLRQCNDTFFKNRTRPCLQYQIKRCTAPCVGYVDKDSYKTQVIDAILFLEGKSDRVIDQLIKRMESASEQQHYEAAASFRDQVAQLRRLQKQQVVTGGHGNMDVIGVSQQMGYMGLVILFIRGARLIGDHAFFPDIPSGTDRQTAVSAFVSQYYLSPLHQDEVPEQILLSERLENRLWIQEALSALCHKKITISDTPRPLYLSWIRLASDNATAVLRQRLTQKHSITAKLTALQSSLQLPNPIRRIECFDVSHTMGEATVASCVVFTEAGASKKEYRCFNITGVTPGDDYGALRQALTRRYTRLKTGGFALPDLLIIDGGMGQLKQAADVLEELQVSGVGLMAVAKGRARKPGLEKLYLWGKKSEIHLPPETKALHLIQYVRDEAHRFALRHHRAKRASQRNQSPLQQIQGVGPKRRQQLLKHFGGLQALQQASVVEIGRVSGISVALAQRIYDVLHGIA